MSSLTIHLLIEPQQRNKLNIPDLHKFIQASSNSLEEKQITILNFTLIAWRSEIGAAYTYELSTEEDIDIGKIFRKIIDKNARELLKNSTLTIIDDIDTLNKFLDSRGLKEETTNKGNRGGKMPPKKVAAKKASKVSLKNKYLLILNQLNPDLAEENITEYIENIIENLKYNEDLDLTVTEKKSRHSETFYLLVKVNKIRAEDIDSQAKIEDSILQSVQDIIYTQAYGELQFSLVTDQKEIEDTLKGKHNSGRKISAKKTAAKSTPKKVAKNTSPRKKETGEMKRFLLVFLQEDPDDESTEEYIDKALSYIKRTIKGKKEILRVESGHSERYFYYLDVPKPTNKKEEATLIKKLKEIVAKSSEKLVGRADVELIEDTKRMMSIMNPNTKKNAKTTPVKRKTSPKKTSVKSTPKKVNKKKTSPTTTKKVDAYLVIKGGDNDHENPDVFVVPASKLKKKQLENLREHNRESWHGGLALADVDSDTTDEDIERLVDLLDKFFSPFSFNDTDLSEYNIKEVFSFRYTD